MIGAGGVATVAAHKIAQNSDVFTDFMIASRRKEKCDVLVEALRKKEYGKNISPSVMSDFLWSHGLQQARLPCPSPTPRACSNLCPSNQWCHPTISFSVVPFSSCLQSFPASESFPMRQFFTSGGQLLELQLQHQVFDWIFRTDFLLDWLLWSPWSPRDSQESSPTPQSTEIPETSPVTLTSTKQIITKKLIAHAVTSSLIL